MFKTNDVGGLNHIINPDLFEVKDNHHHECDSKILNLKILKPSDMHLAVNVVNGDRSLIMDMLEQFDKKIIDYYMEIMKIAVFKLEYDVIADCASKIKFASGIVGASYVYYAAHYIVIHHKNFNNNKMLRYYP